jgi:hypothetical protein
LDLIKLLLRVVKNRKKEEAFLVYYSLGASPMPLSVSPGGDRGTPYGYVGYPHRRHGWRRKKAPQF